MAALKSETVSVNIFRYDLIPMLLGELDGHERIIADLWRDVDSRNIDNEAALQAGCKAIKDSSPLANLFQALQQATAIDNYLRPVKFLQRHKRGAPPERHLEVIKIICLLERILRTGEQQTWEAFMESEYEKYGDNVPHFKLIKEGKLSLASRLLSLLSCESSIADLKAKPDYRIMMTQAYMLPFPPIFVIVDSKTEIKYDSISVNRKWVDLTAETSENFVSTPSKFDILYYLMPSFEQRKTEERRLDIILSSQKLYQLTHSSDRTYKPDSFEGLRSLFEDYERRRAASENKFDSRIRIESLESDSEEIASRRLIVSLATLNRIISTDTLKGFELSTDEDSGSMGALAKQLSKQQKNPPLETENSMRQVTVRRDENIRIGGNPIKFYINLKSEQTASNQINVIAKDSSELSPPKKLAPPKVWTNKEVYTDSLTDGSESDLSHSLLQISDFKPKFQSIINNLAYPPHKDDSFLTLPRWLDVQVANLLTSALSLPPFREHGALFISQEIGAAPGPLLKALITVEHFLKTQEFSETWRHIFEKYVTAEVQKVEKAEDALKDFDPLGYLTCSKYSYALRLMLLSNSRRTTNENFDLCELYENYETYSIFQRNTAAGQQFLIGRSFDSAEEIEKNAYDGEKFEVEWKAITSISTPSRPDPTELATPDSNKPTLTDLSDLQEDTTARPENLNINGEAPVTRGHGRNFLRRAVGSVTRGVSRPVAWLTRSLRAGFTSAINAIKSRFAGGKSRPSTAAKDD